MVDDEVGLRKHLGDGPDVRGLVVLDVEARDRQPLVNGEVRNSELQARLDEGDGVLRGGRGRERDRHVRIVPGHGEAPRRRSDEEPCDR